MKNFYFLPMVLALTTSLAGCAVTPEKARSLTSFELCEKMFIGDLPAQSISVIREELYSRSYNCERDKELILTRYRLKKQKDAAVFEALMGASRAIQATQPPPATYSPTQTNCRVVKNPYGDRIYCNSY